MNIVSIINIVILYQNRKYYTEKVACNLPEVVKAYVIKQQKITFNKLQT